MEESATYIASPEVQKTAELTRLDKELQLMETRSRMQFALTPVGQALKRFEVNQRMGQMYAASSIVPAIYHRNPANCAIAIDMAIRMNAEPLMVMQNLYIVHGNPAWSSKFLIATVNTCGRYMPLRYECNNKEGDEYGWRCYTYAKDDINRKERLEGAWVTWKMVKAEGWDSRSGSKWRTMPEVMFRYRAAAFWQREYAPEISMGFNTVEEMQDIGVEDVGYTEVSAAPSQVAKPGSLADMAMQNARRALSEEPQAPAPGETPFKAEGEFQPVTVPDMPGGVDPVTGEIFPES